MARMGKCDLAKTLSTPTRGGGSWAVGVGVGRSGFESFNCQRAEGLKGDCEDPNERTSETLLLVSGVPRATWR